MSVKSCARKLLFVRKLESFICRVILPGWFFSRTFLFRIDRMRWMEGNYRMIEWGYARLSDQSLVCIFAQRTDGRKPFLDKPVASPYNQRDFSRAERTVECD